MIGASAPVRPRWPALISAWPGIAGRLIRLAGATLDQYDPDVLGSLIGYLPQQVTLFDGTIAENIARLAGSRPAARGRRPPPPPRIG